MKPLFLFLLGLSSLQAQAILDNWAGYITNAVASTSPTQITTATPHGLATGMCISVYGATASGANGQWVNMNNQQAVFMKSSLSAIGTSVYVGETYRLEPTPNATWFIYNRGPSYPGVPSGNEYITLPASNLFPTSRIVNIATRGVNSTSAVAHMVSSQLNGPTSRPAGYAVTNVSLNWKITNVDATHFTIPLNSSTFGSFAGQTAVFYERATCNNQGQQLYAQFPGDGSVSEMHMTPNGTMQLVVDSCPNINDALGCSMAYNSPTGFRGYGTNADSGSLVVSGGTGSITLTAFLTDASPGTTFAAGQLAWLWNFNDYNGPGLPFGTINRPWVIGSVTLNGSGGQTVTFNNMGCSGSNPGQGAGNSSSLGQCVPDGTYTTTGGDTNFFIPLTSDYFTFWVGATTTDKASPTNYAQNPEPAEYPSHMVLATGNAYSPTFNRFRVWWKWGVTSTNMPGMTWETYGFLPHVYRTVQMDSTYAGQWGITEYTAQWDHVVGPSNVYIPQGTDPIYNGWVGVPGDNTVVGIGGLPLATYHDMDQINGFALNMNSGYGVVGAQTAQIGPMYYDEVDAAHGGAEPEEWTPVRWVTYNPGTGKYHMSVGVPGHAAYVFVGTNNNTVTYDFFHCTSNPNIVGLSDPSCTSDGTATSASNSQATTETSAVALANTMYIVFRPHMIVNAVSSGFSGNVTLGFQADPNMIAGDHVATSGIGGNTGTGSLGANQTNVSINAVQPRQIFFHYVPGTGAAGPFVNIQSDGTASSCTVNFNVQPNVFVNQWIWFSGLTGFGNTNSNPGGVFPFQVTGVGTNSFTIACPPTTTPSTTFSTDACSSHTQGCGAIVASPFVTLNATNNGTWDGQYNGIMVSTENLKNFAEINFTPPRSGCQFSTTSLPGAHMGTGYNQQISMLGCAAPAFSVSAGSLPAWASLNSATGAITGTPSGPTPTTGSSTIAVSDANGNPTQAFSLTTDTLPVFSTTSPLPAATLGSAYSQTFSFSAGDAPITCTATGVPAGLNLSSSCVLSGTPTSSGAATINVTASNSSGNTQTGAPTAFALTINPASSVSCPGTVCATGQVTISGASKSGH